MNKLDIADELTIYTNQLDNIAELMLINLNNSDISKSKELDRLYFLNDYIKELSNQLYNFSNEIIKERWEMTIYTLNLIQYITLIVLSVGTGYILHGIIDAIKDDTFFD